MAFVNTNTTNNARSTLALPITAGASSFEFHAGEGALYPASNFRVTFTKYNTSGLFTKKEVVLVATRTGDTCTGLTRAYEACVQDETADPKVSTQNALAFDATDTVELLMTAGHDKDLRDEVSTATNASNLVHKTGIETVTGDKTFTGTETFADDKARSATNAAPTTATAFTNKKYVDDQIVIASAVETTKKVYTAGEDLTAGDAVYVAKNDEVTRLSIGNKVSSLFALHSSGTRYVLMTTPGTDVLVEYSCIGGDVNTGVLTGRTKTITQGNYAAKLGGFFSENNDKFFFSDYVDKKVYSYTLTVPGDITTITYDTKFLDYSSQIIDVRNICFRNNGSDLYLSGGGNKLSHWHFATPYDTATATHVNTIVLGEQYSIVSEDGLYVLAWDSSYVKKFPLSTAFDTTTIGTATTYTYANSSYSGPLAFFGERINAIAYAGGTTSEFSSIALGGQIIKTDASDTKKINFIGFADSTVTAGNPVVVNLTYDDNQSGLTVGDTYSLPAPYISATTTQSDASYGTQFLASQENGQKLLLPVAPNIVKYVITGFTMYHYFAGTSTTVKYYNASQVLQSSNTITVTSGYGQIANFSSILPITVTPGEYIYLTCDGSMGSVLVTSTPRWANGLAVRGTPGSFTEEPTYDKSFSITYDTYYNDGKVVKSSSIFDPAYRNIVVGVADSTTSIHITNKKGGGWIAKGTSSGSATVTTGFYPKYVLTSSTDNTTIYADEADISNKTQTGFDIGAARDRVARG